jgi:hypothetical protein
VRSPEEIELEEETAVEELRSDEFLDENAKGQSGKD